MKAAFIRQTGPAANIVFDDFPDPVPGEREVVVAVGAVSVNPVDTYVRAGMMPFQLPLPFVVGCDLAGTVVAAGPGCRRFKPGDRVWGSNQGLAGRQGCFAERGAVHEDWIYPTPDGVRDEDAAALALVGITAHLGLVGRAALQQGESIFVVGGTGGVGAAVIQMAKALGARVATCCGSREKCDAALALGADHAFNYHEVDIAAGIAGFAPGGVDVFWETRREPDLATAIECAAPRGRLVLMSGRGSVVPLPVGPFYAKQLSLLGYLMFACTADEQRRCADDMNRWMREGRLRPRIDRILPLAETAQAHRLQEESTVEGRASLAGKIVLTP